MGLRLTEGVDAAAMARRFGLPSLVDQPRVDRLVGSGHLTREGTRIALTSSGRLLLDYILGQVAAVEPKALAVEQEA
jgi:oxygen-independent coproporphyrinogen-3 oxidase